MDIDSSWRGVNWFGDFKVGIPVVGEMRGVPLWSCGSISCGMILGCVSTSLSA